MYVRVTTLPTAGSGPLLMVGGGVAAVNSWVWLAVMCAIACCTLALWNRSGLSAGLAILGCSLALVSIVMSGQVYLLLLALAAFTLIGAVFALERSLPVPLLGVFKSKPKKLAPAGRPQPPLHPKYGCR